MEHGKNHLNCNNETIIDWEQCLKLANNKPDLAKDLLSILIEELPAARENIEAAYLKKNYRELYQYVHKLHGASCYCGVPRLRKLIAMVENQLKVSNTNTLDNLLQKLHQEVENVQIAFTKIDFSKI